MGTRCVNWRDIDQVQLLTDENVIRLWASASNLEELHQIKELAMDVTANLVWCRVSWIYAKLIVHTVTGASTTWTLLSSTRISLALMHSRLTCSSDIGVHWMSCSIWLGSGLARDGTLDTHPPI